MRYILLTICFTFSIFTYSQNHSYSYDAAGNRIARDYNILVNPLRKAAPKDSISNSVSAIKAYPNPFNDQLTISLDSSDPNEIINRMQLLSIDGKVVIDMEINQAQKIINTNQTAKGKYLLRIIRNNKTEEFIIIKN
jgi:hypothetical protein